MFSVQSYPINAQNFRWKKEHAIPFAIKNYTKSLQRFVHLYGLDEENNCSVYIKKRFVVLRYILILI